MCTFNSTVKWGQHCSVVAKRRPSKYRKGPAHHWDSVPLPTRWHSLVRSWSQGWWKGCRTSQVEGGKCFKVESGKESMKARCWKTRNMHCDFSAGASFLKKIIILFIYLAVLGLSCHTQTLSCDMGMEPGSPALGVQSLSHWTTREVPRGLFW